MKLSAFDDNVLDRDKWPPIKDWPPKPADMPTIKDAIQIAVNAHRGQLDKAGVPYILHVLRVMLQMETETEKIVAVLHDVLEDTSVEISSLENKGFSGDIIEALKCLTRDPKQDYDDYIEQIKSNSISTKVKIADLTDNLNISRIKQPSKEDFDRKTKYQKALEMLISVT